MTGHPMATTPHELRVREARHQFFDRGEGADIELPQEVLRSWLRCRDSGVDYRDDGRGDPEGRFGLDLARERSQSLLSNAAGIMEHVFEQIRASGSMVILADSQGMILHSMGDPDFVSRAQRVALQPGSSWSESVRGTNAIGTTLVEAAPVEVNGAEHFLDRNGILTCSASPVFSPRGEIEGVLDISGDYRGNQRHTLGLARLAAQLLEKRLFEIEFARELLIAFHSRPECVGGLQEGLLAVSSEGRVVGANPVARALLGVKQGGMVCGEFGTLFRLPFGTFIDRCSHDVCSLQALELRGGEPLYARIRGRVPTVGKANSRSDAGGQGEARSTSGAGEPAGRNPPCDRRSGRATLECLSTGDARLQLALDRAARIMGKDIPLLIQGESGVGKELFARAFHYSSPRQDGPFVAVNCAAIPENLIESELFGYVGGAFTGARREGAVGKIQQAHGGTLFLDEIGDMPLAMQARLLRVLQERCVTPVGAQRNVPVDITLVCATHRVLRESVRNGSFREDLYYRVNGLTVTLPPLRDRSDIRSIVAIILASEVDPARGEVTISEQVLDFFERYPWPGNVRQLQNVIRVAVALLDDDEYEILPLHLPEELFGSDPMDDAESGQASAVAASSPAAAAVPVQVAAGRSLDEIELDAISRVMLEEGGNVSAAARRLGISRNTLYRKIGRMK